MSIASISGISSGVQWRDLIDQIMKVEARPAELLQKRIDRNDAKTAAWGQFKAKVEAFKATSTPLGNGSAFKVFNVALSGMASGTDAPLSVTADEDALPGSHDIVVKALAAHERLGSASFGSRTDARGIAGELLINGKAVEVEATDSLNDIVTAINAADAGVTATVLTTGTDAYRITLTSDEGGVDGIQLADASGDVLRSLGFLDATASIKTATSSGAKGDGLSNSSTAVATLLGLGSPPASGAVSIGGVAVTIDLSTQGLDTIASAINTAATGAGKSFTASVVEETVDGDTVERLQISGTTSFSDTNRILETLGILEAGRSAVAQKIQGNAFTVGDAVTVATTGSKLVDLWVGGADANVIAGDTIAISGTRGDGTTFTVTHAVANNDTLQTILDKLNDASTGFKAGSRTATASLSGTGRIVVTDDAGGDSQLALSMVANNEGGGRLDFGTFDVAELGRKREISAGADSVIEVNGTRIVRTSNTITDAVSGLTFKLTSAAPATTITATVSRDVDKIVASVKALVDGYNTVAEYVNEQFAGVAEGQTAKPLSGESMLRSMRAALKTALETSIASTFTGAYPRLADLGIEIDKTGKFTLDTGKLKTAIDDDFDAVVRRFANHGAGSTSTLKYSSATAATDAGTYSVSITQAATQAIVTGSGFGGSYVDDGTADTMTVRDTASNASYAVSLSNGMTLTQIVDALNAELTLAKKHQIRSATTLYSSAGGALATESTTWSSVYKGDGSSAGVASGDVITISGTKHDGTTFLAEYTVTDAATDTIGGLRSALERHLGSNVSVTFEDGRFVATARETGSSLMTLTLSSDNAGGGSLSFGTVDVVTAGRGKSEIAASAASGELRLTHGAYGSGAGFEISYTAGGADGSASLGLAAGTTSGLNVAGTVGGHAASGSGRTLTGGAGSAVEGLAFEYTGTGTGAVGSMTFSRGVGSAVELASDVLLATETEAGSIAAVIDSLNETNEGLNSRIDALNTRLDLRREQLVRRFTAMEQALSRAQAQTQWLLGQIGQLAGYQQGQQ